jgi:thymidylate synthase
MNIEHDYLRLLKDVLDNGKEKEDRTGTGTISVFGRQIRHKMNQGFPLLTTKKMYWKGIVTELLWFLRGDTNIKYLVDNDCHIWDGDAYKKYEEHILKQRELQKNRVHELRRQGKRLKVVKIELLSKEEFINKIKTDDEFAKKWGDLGPVYGKQWRSWGGELITKRIIEEGKIPISQNIIEGQIDQIENLIEQLKTNPDSRRLMVNAWNPSDLPNQVLPPCHYGFQVYTRELSYHEKVHEARKRFGFELEDGTITFDINTKESVEFLQSSQRGISLMWNQRSVDTFLGLPFNIASYGLLLEIIAKEVNMVPDELIGNLGDVHLYKNHIEQAKEQMTREPMELPKLNNFVKGLTYVDNRWQYYEVDNFTLENYHSRPPIKAPLSN